jgi:hypothetical protein
MAFFHLRNIFEKIRRFVFGKFVKTYRELDNRYTFALSYPYSFSRVKAIEQRLATKKPECVKVEPFAESSVSIIVRSVMEFLTCGYKRKKKKHSGIQILLNLSFPSRLSP